MTIRFLLLLILVCFYSAASAVTISVNTFTDELNSDGDCSLREAVSAANNNVAVDACAAGSALETDVIDADLFGTFTLTMGTLLITDRVEIVGFGRQITRIDGNNQTQIFRVLMTDMEHDFSVSKMTLQKGRSTNTSPGWGGGAAQLEQGDTFTFTEVNFDSNQTFDGGGGAISTGPLIGQTDARLELDRCHFFNNYAEEGGGAVQAYAEAGHQVPAVISIIENQFKDNSTDGAGGAVQVIGVATVVIRDSQFENNMAEGSGGALSYFSGAAGSGALLQVQESAFINNFADSNGGAAQLGDGTVLLTNSTFTENMAGNGLGGNAIATFSGNTATIQYSTFYENGLGQADDSSIYVCTNCDVSLRSTLVWTESPDDRDCVLDFNATYTSLGYNVDGSETCATTQDDLVTADPLLHPLGAYGGDVFAFYLKSMPPRSSSPLIDLGASGSCPGPFGVNLTSDQRGLPRPVDGNGSAGAQCDTGAVEYQPGTDPADFTLDINIQGGGSGTVTSTPAGIDCQSDCSASFLEDTVVQLQALASPGSQFSGWTGDCSGMGACEVLMGKNRFVTATFATTQNSIFADSFE